MERNGIQSADHVQFRYQLKQALSRTSSSENIVIAAEHKIISRMKSFVATVLFSLVIIGTSQPIEEASAIPNDVTAALESKDDSAFPDMEGSESSLKVIEHKLEHWLKKYYKKTDKKNENGFGGYPQAGFPMMGFPSYPLIGYPLMGYGYGLGGLNGFNLGLGGFDSGLGGGFAPGLGGYGTGLGFGGLGTGLGLGGYGYGTGGYGGLGGFGYRR